MTAFNTICRTCGKTVANTGHTCGGLFTNARNELDEKLEALLKLSGLTLDELNKMREEHFKKGANLNNLVLSLPRMNILGMPVAFASVQKAEVTNLSMHD